MTDFPNSFTPEEISRIDALRRLASGDCTGWSGLADYSPAMVEAALGRSRGDADLTGFPGGVPTAYRIYPATPAAPHGVYLWYEEDRAVALQMHEVALTRPPGEQLGEPEARDISRMPGFKTQWIYASRGLTLHVDDDTGAVSWLYAYPPMSLADYRNSWLFRVEILRHRVEL